MARCPDWRLAARVVTYRRVEWAIDYFAPYKSLGMDGILLAMLQEGLGAVIPYLVRIFHACLSIGCVPAIWRQVKVVFIPKPGRNSYSRPTDYRLISLTLFLLKIMNRPEDRYLQDEELALMPLQPNQLVETALH